MLRTDEWHSEASENRGAAVGIVRQALLYFLVPPAQILLLFRSYPAGWTCAARPYDSNDRYYLTCKSNLAPTVGAM